MRYERQQTPSFLEYLFRLGIHPLFKLYWKPKFNGGRYLPLEKPCFVYGNHANNYDPFILNIFTRWGDSTAGVLTQEYFRKPFLRKGLEGIRLLPTRKHLPDPQLIRKLYKKIEKRESIVIYPEGGRRWSGRPIPWIESTAKIFVKSGIPIYPVVTHGSYVSWPRWATYPRPARLRIELHDPFVFDRKTPFEEALKKLKAPIEIDECIVPEDVKPKWAYKPAAGIHLLLYRDPETGENAGVYTPDGNHVINRAGTYRYKMLPDSTLLDEKTDDILTTGELHERVRTLPLEPSPEGDLVRNNVEMHVEEQFPELIPKGVVEASLYPDAIVLKNKDVDMRIGLESIQLPGVERNSKLQLFMQNQMVQLNFVREGSALQWQETITRLKEKEISPASLETSQ